MRAEHVVIAAAAGTLGFAAWRIIAKKMTDRLPPPPGIAPTGDPSIEAEEPAPAGDLPAEQPTALSLVNVQGFGKVVRLRSDAAAALAQMIAAARADGIPAPLLLPVSGYRTQAEQQAAFAKAVANYGSEAAARKWVAKPGYGGHQTGRAVDLWLGINNASSNVDAQRKTAVWRWLVENAATYGFYPYAAEPWHWEYMYPHGTVDVAQEIAQGQAAGVLV